jgi:hypothetical protein
VDQGEVRAWSDPDSTGQVVAVTYDAHRRRWSAPAPWTPPAQTFADSLGWVHEFSGGLFDRFPRASLALGDGFSLARRDTGVALVDDATGKDVGWPPVTDEDVDRWGTEMRIGLPRDFPEDRLRVLLARGQLKNEPGPTAVLGGVRWFGLKGGFAGAVGQIGGLVGFDPARRTYDDETRGYVDGTVWRLGETGRPLAIITAELHPNYLGSGPRIVYDFLSLTRRPFTARSPDIPGWSPRAPAVVLKALPKAPEPSTVASKRLTQLKEQARRFSGTQEVQETDKTFVPNERSGSPDKRRLGLRIFQFDVK